MQCYMHCSFPSEHYKCSTYTNYTTYDAGVSNIHQLDAGRVYFSSCESSRLVGIVTVVSVAPVLEPPTVPISLPDGCWPVSGPSPSVGPAAAGARSPGMSAWSCSCDTVVVFYLVPNVLSGRLFLTAHDLISGNQSLRKLKRNKERDIMHVEVGPCRVVVSSNEAYHSVSNAILW